MIEHDLEKVKRHRALRKKVADRQWGIEENPLEHTEHEVAELICLKCLQRWIGVYYTDLKDITCECGAKGFIIKTGQSLKEIDDGYYN